MRAHTHTHSNVQIAGGNLYSDGRQESDLYQFCHDSLSLSECAFMCECVCLLIVRMSGDQPISGTDNDYESVFCFFVF